jgi:hypothetical protein
MEVEGWGGQKPCGEVLDEIAQAGYTGAELGSMVISRQSVDVTTHLISKFRSK